MMQKPWSCTSLVLLTLAMLLTQAWPGMCQTVPIRIYSTGLGDDFHPLAEGNTDAHYVIVSAPDGTQATPFAPDVVETDGFPFVNPQYPDDLWLTNDAGSQWIGPQANYYDFNSDPVGDYDYQMAFDLTGFDPASATVTFQYVVDNVLAEVLLNGTPVATNLPAPPDFAFATWSDPVHITANFIAGTNTLDFIVYNTPPPASNPSGLRVQIAGSAAPTGAPRLTIVPAGNNVLLKWPTNAAGFTLETSPNLEPAAWSPGLPAPVVLNDQYVVTNAVALTQQFYRLSKGGYFFP